MIFDTSVIVGFIRSGGPLPARILLSVIVAGELEVMAVRNKWGARKRDYLQRMRERYPTIEVTSALILPYAHLDTYSQNHLPQQPLPPGLTARNMGKNDLWIAATALYFDVELHTTDNDFDHLGPAGVRVVKL